MPESKSILQSKKVWANVATALVMIATVYGGANRDPPLLSAEEATAIVTAVFTLVNVIMRLVTRGPAHVLKTKNVGNEKAP